MMRSWPARNLPPLDENPSGLDVAMTSSALALALGGLSNPHREVLILRFYEDMKILDFTVPLDIPRWAAISWIFMSS